MTFMDALRSLVGRRYSHRRTCALPCCIEPNDGTVAEAVSRNAAQAQELRDLSLRSVRASGAYARAVSKVVKRLEGPE